MKLIFKIVQWLVFQGLNYLYAYIDENSDGKLDKKEITKFINKLKRIKK